MQQAEKRQLDDVLVSIVVPVYNVENYLRQCVDSLLAQTHSNVEIILVDDGSTDKSGELCDEYAAGYERICVLHQKNAGLSAARNKGIDYAKGDFIGFVDSDDFVSPDMYRMLLEAALTYDAPLSACGRYITDESGVVTGEAKTLHGVEMYDQTKAVEEILSFGSLDVAAWDKLYRKDLLNGIEFPEGRINEDAATIFKLMKRVDSVVHVGAPLYYYRQRGGSITKSGYNPKQIQAIEHAEQIEKIIGEQWPQLRTAYERYIAYVACHLLVQLMKEPNAAKKYPEHHARYQKALRTYRLELFRNPNISVSWKMRGAAILMGIYGPLYALLK